MLFVYVNCNAKCTNLWSERVIQNHAVYFINKTERESETV